MEFIEIGLQLVPVPYLDFCFTIFKTIWDAVKEVQASKVQFTVLGQSVANLLQTLDKGFRSGRLNNQDSTSDALLDLERLLKDVSAYIQKQCSFGFFKLLLFKDERLAAIDTFHRRISNSVNTFQIAALIDLRIWQMRNEEARQTDQGNLHAQLRHLEANQRLLIEALEVPRNNSKAMMATLQRRVSEKKGDQEELRFLKHSLRYLSSTSGQVVDLQQWTITAYDVEFGPLIGVGGFGKVYRGKWNHTDVALKVMKNAGEITPRAAAVRREVDTWSKLRHPNILQFLGANILDDEPFLVMPLIEGGNARDYIDNNPHCNRLKIIQQISLGLTYLHTNSIVHGDLKAVNVLIDDAEKALLCDFGLARIKADVNSRASDVQLQGSHNWMAPELFQGRSLRMPCDIYSFAMTIYEIYTGEIPFGNVSPNLIPKLVVKRGARPERPAEEEAPYLSDEVWDIAEHCWSQNPADRPLAITLSETLTALLSSAPPKTPHRPPSYTYMDATQTADVEFGSGSILSSTVKTSYSTLVSPLTSFYDIPELPHQVRVNRALPDTPPRSTHQFIPDSFTHSNHVAMPVPQTNETVMPVPQLSERGTSAPPPVPDITVSGDGSDAGKPAYDAIFKFPSFVISLPKVAPITQEKKGPKIKLILSLDIGVSYSGISYSIIDDDQISEIKGVTIFTDHDQVSGSSKVPTTIYYDELGQVCAIGAETLVKEVIKMAETKGWRKIKWFKLHLWPHTIAGQPGQSGHSSLPFNKRPEDVLTDYLVYLHQCAVTYIQKTHVNWKDLWNLSNSPDTQFILSYPNGWQGIQEKMRYAAIRARLIPDTPAGNARLSFVTEGEANLAFMVSHGGKLLSEVHDEVVVLVDAGDYMINISSYVRKPRSKSLSFEEISQPQRHMCGSIYVTSLARAFFQRTLANSKFKDRVEVVLESFERTTKFKFCNPQQYEYLMVGPIKDNDKKRNIKNGQMKVLGSDIVSFFEQSVNCIIESVKEQRKTARYMTTHVVLVGELSASEWLFSQVSAAFEALPGYSVMRPNYYINKSVADGSIFHCIDDLINNQGQSISNLTF